MADHPIRIPVRPEPGTSPRHGPWRALQACTLPPGVVAVLAVENDAGEPIGERTFRAPTWPMLTILAQQTISLGEPAPWLKDQVWNPARQEAN